MSLELPAWAIKDRDKVYCTNCGAESDELPVSHSKNCIYRLDIVA